MPAGSLLTLLDDITVLMDDVWVMTKLSAKKTAGVLGDDLALNAEQAVGLRPERELPVIAAVAKGSLKNKAILVPMALLLSFLAPWAILPLLLFGGVFLCYEGVEKLVHKFGGAHHEHHLKDEKTEQERIAGAVRTDFILSAEIIVLTLGIVGEQDFGRTLMVLLAISLLMTVGVYGSVAMIVKLDDIGLALQNRAAAWQRKLGALILAGAPRLLSLISWLGTLAIFAVGGGIIVHSIDWLHHHIEEMHPLLGLGAEGATGLVVGALALLAVKAWRRFSAMSFTKVNHSEAAPSAS